MSERVSGAVREITARALQRERFLEERFGLRSISLSPVDDPEMVDDVSHTKEIVQIPAQRDTGIKIINCPVVIAGVLGDDPEQRQGKSSTPVVGCALVQSETRLQPGYSPIVVAHVVSQHSGCEQASRPIHGWCLVKSTQRAL